MIQRIQSLYLIFITLLSGFFLKGSFLKFNKNSGSEIYLNFRGIWETTLAGNPHMIISLIPLSVIMLTICVLSFAAIFLFRKRRIQLKLTLSLIILTIAFIGMMLYYLFWVIGKYHSELIPGFKMFIPLVILVFGILAYVGIKKDENLVKSYDRLR